MNTVSENMLPLTRIQRLIGKLMLQSKREGPCSYLESRVDMTELANMRKSYYRATRVRVSTNDFFFCAIAGAMKKFPLMAGQFDKNCENIQIPEHVGIGFAVTAPQGLVVPVIKNVLEKFLPQIAAESSALIKKARANKLDLDDFDGANITFSSLGMYGISSFFAIKPPGTAGIISIGKFEDTVVPVDGEAVVRKTMSVGLAVDRRIVSDLYAAKFLGCVRSQLENPETLTT